MAVQVTYLEEYRVVIERLAASDVLDSDLFGQVVNVFIVQLE